MDVSDGENDGSVADRELLGIDVPPPCQQVLAHPRPVMPPTHVLADARQFLDEYASDNDFHLKTLSSTKDSDGNLRYIYLACSKGGPPREGVTESDRQREFKTVLTNCPFKLALCRRQGRPWTLANGKAISYTHNHPRFDISTHPLILPEEAEALIKEQLLIGIPPERVLETVTRRFPLLPRPPSMKEIYNLSWAARQGLRGQSTISEAVVDMLKAEGCLYRGTQDDESRRLVTIAISTPEARALHHRWPSVLFVDATYKTNKLNLPMIHFVGFTATNQSFTAGFAFVQSEREDHVIQAMSDFQLLMGHAAVKTIITDRDITTRAACATTWPDAEHILCGWHIDENIRKLVSPPLADLYGKTDFGDVHPRTGKPCTRGQRLTIEFIDEWHSRVINARTETELQSGLATLLDNWGENRFEDDEGQPLLLNALNECVHIVQTCKEHLVHAYIDQFFHLGQRANSRLEGLHSAVKSYIGSKSARATADQVTTITAILRALRRQWDRILERMEHERNSSLFRKNHIFRPLKARVSEHAVSLTERQLAKAHRALNNPGDPLDNLDECTGTFSRSHGLPCAHRILDVLVKQTFLQLGDFHRHWWLTSAQDMRSFSNSITDKIEEVLANGGGDESNNYSVALSGVSYINAEELKRTSERLLDPNRVVRGRTRRARQLATGRLATAAEIEAGPRWPQERPCRSCGHRHPRELQCIDRRLERYIEDDVSSDENTAPPSSMLSGAVERCFYCRRPHGMRGCARLQEWRRKMRQQEKDQQAAAARSRRQEQAILQAERQREKEEKAAERAEAAATRRAEKAAAKAAMQEAREQASRRRRQEKEAAARVAAAYKATRDAERTYKKAEQAAQQATDRERKKAEREAERERKRAEKEAERKRKRAEKDAERARKRAEKDAVERERARRRAKTVSDNSEDSQDDREQGASDGEQEDSDSESQFTLPGSSWFEPLAGVFGGFWTQ